MALGDDIDILSRCEPFNRFATEALRLLAFAGEHRSLRQGDVLFTKGDRADSGYVVKSGSLTLSGATADERRPVVAEPGALIGKLALFIRNTRPVTAVASEPTEVIRISPTLMRRVLEEFPDCAKAAYDSIAGDLSELSEGLEQVRPLFETGQAKIS